MYTGQHSTDIFTQEAIDIVNHHNSSQPLFLLLSYAAVHTPLQAHQKDIDKYSSIADQNRRIYAAMMESADRAIGRVVDAYKDKGIWNDTLLIWSSDNGGYPGLGGGYNWPLRGMKSTVFEGGVRVPAFVHGQMLSRQRQNITDLFHVTDWYPTLVKLAGGKVESEVDGVDQWGVLSEGRPSDRNEVLINIDIGKTPQEERMEARGANYYSGAAIRCDHMKLVYKSPNYTWYNTPESGTAAPTVKMLVNGRLPLINLALYNITADPEERHDVSGEHPAIVKSLMERLRYYNTTVVKSRVQPGDPTSLEVAERLGRWEPWIDEDATDSHASSGSRAVAGAVVLNVVLLALLLAC